MKRTQEWWDKFFLGLAKYISTASKDPSTKVGAVITKGKRVVSTGYNGFASGVRDDVERYTDRDTKLAMILHGDDNALSFAPQDLTNHTMYTYPFAPCSQCAAKLIQRGIARVVSLKSDIDRWKKDWDLANLQYNDVGVELKLYDEI